MKRMILTLTLLAHLSPLSQAAETADSLTLMKIFAAAAVTKQRLRQVPVEFVGLILLTTYAGEPENGIVLPNPRAEDLLPAIDQKDAYWGKQLAAVLRAQQVCRKEAEKPSGLVIVSSLISHARECANLMAARQIAELILEDIGKDRTCARLILAKAWTRQDTDTMRARKIAAFEKIDKLAQP